MSTGTEQSNRRGHDRSHMRARAEIKLNNGIRMQGESKNISESGLLMESERSLPVGNTCKVVIELHDGDKQYKVMTEGQVVRVDDDGIAIEFTKIDLGSMDFLRHAVVYNEELEG